MSPASPCPSTAASPLRELQHKAEGSARLGLDRENMLHGAAVPVSVEVLEGSGPVLGRGREQRLLTALLDEAAKRAQALVHARRPGIGKSRLVSEAGPRPCRAIIRR